MKISVIKGLETQEIDIKLEDLKKELFNLKFQKAFGMLESTANIKTIKKDIARCYTIIKERSIAEAITGDK